MKLKTTVAEGTDISTGVTFLPLDAGRLVAVPGGPVEAPGGPVPLCARPPHPARPAPRHLGDRPGPSGAPEFHSDRPGPSDALESQRPTPPGVGHVATPLCRRPL